MNDTKQTDTCKHCNGAIERGPSNYHPRNRWRHSYAGWSNMISCDIRVTKIEALLVATPGGMSEDLRAVISLHS